MDVNTLDFLFLREDLARIYAAEIVSAVSHLHANGIMHRDLKPENILLDADGHVLFLSFFLSNYALLLQRLLNGDYLTEAFILCVCVCVCVTVLTFTAMESGHADRFRACKEI